MTLQSATHITMQNFGDVMLFWWETHMHALRHVSSNPPLRTCPFGVAMVVMDRQEYQHKTKNLLKQPNTYRPIPADPTNKQGQANQHI